MADLQETNCFINALSDDILLHIFSYLDAISLCKVRRVSHRWHDLSTDEVLWKYKLLSDAKKWKHISNTTLPDHCLRESADEPSDTRSSLEMYLSGSPDIQKFKRNFYEQTTLHQLTGILKRFLPTKKYSVGIDAAVMDEYGRGQSFFSKALAFDAANVFQHCGQFPGRFKGHGGGFLFKYKRHMIELCLMYVAQKNLRATMTADDKVKQLKKHVSDPAYRELLQSLDAYIYTVEASIPSGASATDITDQLSRYGEEVEMLDQYLKPGSPIVVLSCRRVESDSRIQPYDVTKALNLERLQRPWMIAELSGQMIYRDIVDPMDWLVANARPH